MSKIRSQCSFWRWCTLAVLAVPLLAGQPLFGGIQGQTEQIIQSAGLRNTVFAVAVKDLETGEMLAQINMDRPMIPASNMKLLTTAGALSVLGNDFRFTTQLELVGDPAKGPVMLLVRGDGDPSFGDPRMLAQQNVNVEDLLQTMVKDVVQANVKHVAEIVVDDRVFDRVYVHPTWPQGQLDKWYCAQVAGLNFHDNCLDFYPRPTFKGEAPQLLHSPEAPFLKLINRGVTGSKDGKLALIRQMNTNIITFRGTVRHPRTKPISVTLHDPPIFFCQLLANRLQAVGVKVDAIRRPSMEDQVPNGQVLTMIQSTIQAVLTRCNKDSQNLFAEALLKRMGRRVTGAPGSWENGAAALRIFLHDRIGSSGAAVTIADGSGMSRDNRVSARILVELLEEMYRDERLRDSYVNSLSIGGKDGTLQRRFKNEMAGTVYGKSGYISGVSTLSGYLMVPKDGGEANDMHVVIFSLMFNDFKPPIYPHNLKAVQNKLVSLIDADVARRLTIKLGG